MTETKADLCMEYIAEQDAIERANIEAGRTMTDTTLSAPALYELEAAIDRYGIEQTLMALSEICGAKAEHIATDYHDTTLAKRWATIAGAIGCIVPKASLLT